MQYKELQGIQLILDWNYGAEVLHINQLSFFFFFSFHVVRNAISNPS